MVRLSEQEIARHAAAWADELFSAGPAVARVLVRYDGRPDHAARRRNKSAAVRAERAVAAALAAGDLPAADAAASELAGRPEGGLAWCADLAVLAAVLAERLRRGEYCNVDGLLHESAVTVTVWRE